ncbi:MAG: DMT family transporter [Actinomycetota bacterium]|nr:DMT family transporter [Actinomycetota bacterium]
MRLAVVLAVLAGLAVATQTSFISAAQRMIGPVMVVAVSGFTTGLVAFTISLLTNRAELTSRAFGYSLASGVLGAFIVGAIAFAAGQGGVARALSLVVASQLLFGLLFDALGLLGAVQPAKGVRGTTDPGRWRPRGTVLGLSGEYSG